MRKLRLKEVKELDQSYTALMFPDEPGAFGEPLTKELDFVLNLDECVGAR
jgi:hypothetical protein